jgi:hypothetical protein
VAGGGHPDLELERGNGAVKGRERPTCIVHRAPRADVQPGHGIMR